MRCVLYLICVVMWCHITEGLIQYKRRRQLCPCVNTLLCQRLYRTTKGLKELIVYSHDADDYLKWHWQNITMVITNGFDDSHGLMCYAHKENSKYGKLVTGIPEVVFTNKSHQTEWLTERYREAIDNYYDVISFDIQHMVTKTEERRIVIQFVKKVKELYGRSLEISYNMPLCLECKNESCGDVAVIAKYSDFLNIEFCNINIHSKPPSFFGTTSCLGRPVMPYSTILRGYNDYILAGVPLGKIVMGVPWFAFDYTCSYLENSTLRNECHLSSCSERPKVLTLKEMLHLKLEFNAVQVWVSSHRTAYFDYYHANTWHQVWFEDFTSTASKYELAKDIRIRGVALLYADYVDYRTAEEHQKFFSNAMWNVVDVENLPEGHSIIHWNASLGGTVAALAVVLIVVGMLIGMSVGAWLYKYKLSKRNFAHQRVPEEDADGMTAMSSISRDHNGVVA